MMTGKQADIDQIVKEILKEIKNVRAIYLFGSMSRGDDKAGSDYDIAVIVNKHPDNDLDLITNVKFSLIDKINRQVDVVLLDTTDLDNSPVFLYELYNNRKQIFGIVDVLKDSRCVVEKIRPIMEDNKTIGYHV
jgi:predicted nucleotidyltransferase